MNYLEEIEMLIPGLPGWSTVKKSQTLFNLITEIKPNITVDIGVFGGRSTIAMAFAHKEVGGYVVGIDPWTAAACLEGENDAANDDWWSKLDYEALYRGFIIQLLAHDLTDVTNILRMKSEQVHTIYRNSVIGLVHLDGNHSELLSCRDVELWAPLVAENGYILFDDSSWPTTQAAQQLLLNYGFIEVERVKENDGGGEVEWTIYKKIAPAR
jgi:cephalosporin hydroxylase